MSDRIGFIGTGKMGEALISGLISKGVYSKDDIMGCAPSEKTRSHMTGTYGIRMFEKASDMVPEADVIVLGVKPKHVAELFEIEKLEIGSGKIVISMIAGLTLERMNSYMPDAKNVRTMPNHCVMVSEGAAGYVCDPKMTESDKTKIVKILSSTGIAVEIPENLMEAFTGVAGSSPAFYYMVIDAISRAGIANGLPPEDALKLAAQSMLGAAKMVLNLGKTPETLRVEVCSPGGCTIEGVKLLQAKDAEGIFEEAVQKTVDRAIEMKGE